MQFARSALFHGLVCSTVLAVVLVSSAYSATIYKCTGPDGSIVFADTPCVPGAKPQEVVSQPHLSTVPPPATPKPIISGPVGDAAAVRLVDLVKSGSVARLQQYLSSSGVDINDRPGTDEALLDYAAEQNQVAIARFLVEHGARIDAVQSQGHNAGYTALHRAAIADSAEVAELLLAHGAEVDYHGPLGVTPLILAASNGSRRTVVILLNHGANISTPTGHRETALSEATAHGHQDIVQLLLIAQAAAINASNVNPNSASATHAGQSAENTAMHCAITQYTQWIRTQTKPPDPEAKSRKLQEIDTQCGSSLHSANVQSSYEAQLSAAPAAKLPGAPNPTAVAPTPAVEKAAVNPPNLLGLTPDGWPIAPDKHLASIKRIPAGDQIVLEVRNKNTANVPNEIGVFNLTKHTEEKWDILSSAMREIPATQFGAQSDWAPGAGKLLYATLSSLHLVSRDGTSTELHLQMPGKLKALDGMTAYALSADGQRVAYLLATRDIGEKQPDGFGKLYTDLMVQQIEGSVPKSVWRGEGVPNPAWRPDGAAIAHTDSNHNLVVSDLNGRTLWSFHPGPPPRDGSIADFIQEIRWDPSGKHVAFVMGVPIPKLYVVNADGSGMKMIEFRNFIGIKRDLSIQSFAWSPDGRQFAFRSEAGSTCNYLALGYKIDTGSFPCIHSRDLFTADVDGSHITKATAEPDYDFGELFWIQ